MVEQVGPLLSVAARRQDRRWLEYVQQLREHPLPFDEQWQFFEQCFAGRAPEDGPPIVWKPGVDEFEGSNVARFMRARGVSSYEDLHRWSSQHREAFWGAAIDQLGVIFALPPEHVLELSGSVKQPRWLVGAQLNCVDSCLAGPPDALAIVVGSEESDTITRVTLGELTARVNRLANGLVGHGFEPGDAIALYMPMTVDCVVAYLAIIRAGLVVVSIADSFSPAEVRKRLAITGTRAVITVDHYQRGGKSIALYDKVKQADAAQVIVIGETTLAEGDIAWSTLFAEDASFASRAGDPELTTNILFSSGTTGDPKAIPWTHLTPIKCATDGRFHHDIRTGDVVAWPTNIGWMMGPWLIYASLMNRAAIALYEGAPGDAGFTRFVAAAEVTMLGVVPALVRSWRQAEAVGFDAWNRVRVFSSTGEPSNRRDYLWLMSRTAYRAPVIEYLGGTEIGGGHLTGTVVQPASPSTFTTAALGIDFLILGDDKKAVADGQTGELFILPPSIGLSQRLLHRDHDEIYYDGCPRGPLGESLRRHGDEIMLLGRGYFRAQGRADDTMNLSGIKVSSLELERVLDAHAAVYESAAVGVQVGGEGAERLVVFTVLERPIGRDHLRRELSERIAKQLNPLFKIHDLVIIDKLPRTASNKLIRRALRGQYQAGGTTAAPE